MNAKIDTIPFLCIAFACLRKVFTSGAIGSFESIVSFKAIVRSAVVGGEGGRLVLIIRIIKHLVT